jgi:hypothetical protein
MSRLTTGGRAPDSLTLSLTVRDGAPPSPISGGFVRAVTSAHAQSIATAAQANSGIRAAFEIVVMI